VANPVPKSFPIRFGRAKGIEEFDRYDGKIGLESGCWSTRRGRGSRDRSAGRTGRTLGIDEGCDRTVRVCDNSRAKPSGAKALLILVPLRHGGNRALTKNQGCHTDEVLPQGRLLESSPHTKGGSQHMNRIPVSSEGITEVGYHEEADSRGTLELKFSNGGVYEFFNVPMKMYDEFMHSPSREDYYRANIGTRFPCTRVR